jgi:hypothetical protein
MALTDFFRINLPYGIQRNSNDEWFVFNREYSPLGWNVSGLHSDFSNKSSFDKLPVYIKYPKLTDKKIQSIITESEYIHFDNNGKIFKVFFYNDGTNPQSYPSEWKRYFDILKKLSKLLANK